MADLQLRVDVTEIDVDQERLDDLTLSLRHELMTADVDKVAGLTDGPAPPASRGLDATTIGSLLVAVTGSTLAATQAINTIRNWVSRGPKDRKVTITAGDATLTLSNPTTERQQELLTEFLTVVLPAADS